MLCPKCKKEITDGVQFCPECGASIVSKKNKKPIIKKWWFWIVAIFLFIVFIGVIGGDEEPSTSNTNIQTNDTTTVSKDEYKASCEKIAYKDIARLPDEYRGKNVVFTGEVVQVQEGSWSNSNIYRINVTKNEYDYWEDSVYVSYELPEGAPRILENDIVTFYGICEGTYTYESVLGSNITIPSVSALYMDIN